MTPIRKTHADDSNNGMDFVLSDATPDRYGDVIMVEGWDLANFSKNPIALFNHDPNFPVGTWSGLSARDGALRGRLKLAPAGTSPRHDEIRALVKAGILRAVSVGFRPIESKSRTAKNGTGELYLKSELVETSLVSVPANPNALAIAKSLKISPDTIELVFPKNGRADDVTRRRGPSGEQAETHPRRKVGTIMSPISKRIEDTQARIVALKDELTKHLGEIDDENPDETQTAVLEEITTKIEAQEKQLAQLKRAEALVAKSTTMTTNVNDPVVADRGSTQEMTLYRGSRLFAVPSKKITALDLLFKAIATDIKHYGEGRKRGILDVLKENYGDNEMGESIRTVMSRLVTRAAAIPADTTTSGWADTLVQTVVGEFIESLMPFSIYPALRAKGGSFTFGRNGTISLPARTTSTTVAGAFVAQGAAIPVRQGAFTPITITPRKMGVITTMTREITEHSTPQIESILRQAMLEDTGVAIDTILLDATAGSTTRPAGLKNGQTKVSANATATIVGFVADLKGLVAALITATNGNIRAPAWIMNPGDVLAASLLQTTTGETPFRDELARGTLLGYPVLSTTTGLTDMMGIIDAADFMTATGDTPQFSVSDQAVLHMEDTSPAALSAAATPNTVAAPIRSLWQTDSMAVRMILDINWVKRRAGTFQWTDTMTWN